jgi:hypothetical protein
MVARLVAVAFCFRPAAQRGRHRPPTRSRLTRRSTSHRSDAHGDHDGSPRARRLRLITPLCMISVIGQRESPTLADNYADLLRGVPGVTAMQVHCPRGPRQHRVERLSTSRLRRKLTSSTAACLPSTLRWFRRSGPLLRPSTKSSRSRSSCGPASAVWGANAQRTDRDQVTLRHAGRLALRPRR